MHKDTWTGTLHVNQLVDIFDRADNIRNDYQLNELAESIAREGRILEPVHVFASEEVTYEEFKSLGSKQKFEKLVEGGRGFRRVHSAKLLLDNPGLFANGENYDGTVPIIVLFGYDKQQRLDYRLDHNDQKSLDSYEQVLMYKKISETGLPLSEKEICWRMRNILYNSSNLKKREQLDLKLNERAKLADPVADLTAQQEIVFQHWRGRIQRIKNLALDPTGLLLDNERKLVQGWEDHEDPPVNIPKDELFKLVKLSEDEVREWFNQKRHKVDGRKAEEGKKAWSKKVIEEKRTVFKSSHRFDTILRAILGDEDAQEQLIQIRDLMALEEKAKEQNPEGYREMLMEVAKAAKAANE